MEINQALEIISALSDGVDPETGEFLSNESCFNQPQVIRALFIAKSSLEKSARYERRRSALPENAGKPWNGDEDERLSNLFDSGEPIVQIAKMHERTRGAIMARLIRLGKISENDSIEVPSNK